MPDAFSAVDPRYRHIAKVATPGPLLRVGAAELKWYDLAPAANGLNGGVPDEVRALGQAHLAGAVADGSIDIGADAGFVILHRCGVDFYFLLTMIWRGANELWESVHYRSGPMPDFAPFDTAYPPSGPVRPTFCVWELGIVAAESQAWSAYLCSPRTDADREAWRMMGFEGVV